MKPKILIKIGGEILNDEKLSHNLFSSIRKLNARKFDIILVHGGGPQATALSEELSIKPNMVGGRRITCENTLEVMKMVLPGKVSSNLLAIARSLKIRALSLSGISFVNAIKRPPKVISGSNGNVIDFGFVGDVIDIDSSPIELFLSNNYLPIINTLCADQNGMMLNINADTVASHIAFALNVEHFVSVTAVGGIFRDISNPESRFGKLTISEAEHLIDEGCIHSGMIPKVEEAIKIVKRRNSTFHIVNTNTENSLLNEIDQPGSVGTCILDS